MNYTLKRRRGQKTLRMYIKDNGELVVSAPYGTSNRQIESFVLQNTGWIEKNMAKVPHHSYEFGDRLPFAGRQYSLLTVKGRPQRVDLLPDMIAVTCVHPEKTESVKKLLREFYSEKLMEKVQPLVNKWSSKMGIEVPEIKIFNAKRLWGVCYPQKKTVKFSAMAASLDDSLVEMLVIHELGHFEYTDHSPAYWKYVEKFDPQIREKEKALKKISKEGIVKNLF